ncbi:hypothetical protein BDV12DRAFT_200384 [Aspergillus spectabilis]
MSPQPGDLTGPKKWLISRYTEKRNTIMLLGSILTDPSNLESSLNLHFIPPIPEHTKRDAADTARLVIEIELHKKDSFLLSAASSFPVFKAVAELGGSWSGDPRTAVEALNVRATVFVPNKEFMDEALGDKSVVEYVRRGLFAKALYIVVGVATAKKFSVKEEQAGKVGVDASAKTTVYEVGDIGVGASHSREAGAKVEWEIEGECDFAYRVREFEYSRFDGVKATLLCTYQCQHIGHPSVFSNFVQPSSFQMDLRSLFSAGMLPHKGHDECSDCGRNWSSKRRTSAETKSASVPGWPLRQDPLPDEHEVISSVQGLCCCIRFFAAIC